MTVAMVCLGIEVVLLLVLAPISIKVKAHFSLSRKSCQADISVIGAKIVRLRAKATENNIKVFVNGKEKHQKGDGIAIQNIVKTLNLFKVEHIRVVASIVALIGMDEAKNSAMICAMLCGIGGIRAYSDTNSERCDIDLSLKAKVNILQTIKLILSTNK